MHAWETSLKKFGKINLEKALTGAINLAEKGIIIDKYLKHFFEGKVYRNLIKMRWQPSIQIIPHYESEPLYISALIKSIEKKIFLI